jgi:hypothetical protein
LCVSDITVPFQEQPVKLTKLGVLLQ